MSQKPDNKASIAQQAIIAGVDASDLVRARAAVNSGVQSAQKEWIPSHLIVSALALELQDQISAGEHSNELSIYLRRLADFVSANPSSTGRH
ncbi:hypothetical protein N8881_04640 [Pseudomonadales bacterium]|jgi:hypothetical protein|nr:hypothetical protein [Gammaproteobacteria bacterium]MDA7726057.1 hypothetical protein [Pseudomonadales bacterium]MBT3734115.1 hypothetical protein [Gammaproteobacteria bacterium]MBT3899834.1 hypothetical protein [Gammaproteobacteria bacterium]MDA7754854.1 hypothetical protein [Pseudomonadales bacterium]